MSHIKSLSIDNFRVFDKKTELELCPITYLTGPNSSGKSSILKSLLLLKNNCSSNLQVLDFSGPKHNLGTFQNTTCNKIENDIITFSFRFSIGTPEFYRGSFIKEPVTTKRNVINLLREVDVKSTEDIIVELSYRQNERSGKISEIKLLLKDQAEPFVHLTIGNAKSHQHTLKINYDLISRKKIIINLLFEEIERHDSKIKKPEKLKTYTIPIEFSVADNIQKKFFDEPLLVFSKLFEKFVKDNSTTTNSNEEYHNYILSLPLRRILQDLSSLIDNTEYLEAVRANSKRLYTNDSQGTSFNELILDYRSRDIPGESIKFINKWLKKFDIADELILENIEGVATSLYLKKGENRTALADLGYGITQFLPILLKISIETPTSSSKKGFSYVKKLILLEEPETNLHPKFQSLMADFLIDAIKTFEIRFLIETHSEYIIRKTQLLIAEKHISTSDVVIYYFPSNSLSESLEITKIRVKPNGTLDSEFGSGFFDEATNLKLELLKKKILN
jgi:predicted ATP-dependent endonuclease of OLD family